MKPEYFLNKNLSNSKLIEKIINNIDLRFINNHMNREDNFLYRFLHTVIPKKYREYININIIEEDALNNYGKLKSVEKMATVATFYIINSICKNIKKGSYLNIGVWKGFSLFSGMLDTECEVVGVDNFTEFNGVSARKDFNKNFNAIKNNNHFFYDSDALGYLKKCTKKFDFYFYDALHTYDYQYKALELADKNLNKGAIILIDDICWNYSDEPLKATKDFLKNYKNKYQLLLDIRTKYNRHPSFWNGYILIEKIS